VDARHRVPRDGGADARRAERGFVNGEPRTPNVERLESDSPMTKTYVGVLVLEVVIVLALWLFQRAFS
jgi:hypothetical protein